MKSYTQILLLSQLLPELQLLHIPEILPPNPYLLVSCPQILLKLWYSSVLLT